MSKTITTAIYALLIFAGVKCLAVLAAALLCGCAEPAPTPIDMRAMEDEELPEMPHRFMKGAEGAESLSRF